VIFSVGKINHEILIAVVPIVKAYSNWGMAFSVDSKQSDKSAIAESWPLTFVAVLIGFMMFTAGFPKILGGWLDLSTQATQGHLFNQFYMRERQDLLAEAAVNFQSPLFWELLDWGTVLFEIAFLFALIKMAWFKWFLCFAVIFHFSTMMFLNIAFLPNFLAYALFLNWDRIFSGWKWWCDKLIGKERYISELGSVFALAVLLFVLFGALKWISMSDAYLTRSDLQLYEVVIVSVAALYMVYLGFKKIFKRTFAFTTSSRTL
jgi:hypothetical protein